MFWNRNDSKIKETAAQNTLEKLNKTEFLRRTRTELEELFAHEMKGKGLDNYESCSCPIDVAEVQSLIKHIRTDPTVLKDRAGSEESYYHCIFISAFGAGTATAYLYNTFGTKSFLYKHVLSACESVPDDILDGTGVLVYYLLDKKMGKRHQRLLRKINSIRDALEGKFQQAFSPYFASRSHDLEELSDAVLMQAFYEGFSLGQAVIAEVNENKAHPKGYYFENITELMIYGDNFGDAVWLSGDNYLNEYRRGYELFEQGRFREAIEVYQGCLDLNPIGVSARFEICEAYIRLKDFSAARSTLLDMQDYLGEEKSIAKFYRRMGFVETERGNFKVAAACYVYSAEFEKHPSIMQELAYIARVGNTKWDSDPGKILRTAQIPVLVKKLS